MPKGAEIRSLDNQIIFTTTDRLFILLGNLSLPNAASSGTVTNNLFLEGDPFYYLKADFWFRAKWKVDISFAGNVMSWSTTATTTFEDIPGRIYGVIVYGIR